MPIASTSNPDSARATRSVESSLGQALTHAWNKLSFGLSVRAEFYMAMARYAKRGVAPYAVLEELLGVARDRWSKRSLVKVYVSLMEVMKTGVGLPAALEPWIPAPEAAMLRGAQEAGPEVLNQAFLELGEVLIRQGKARGQIMKVIGMNAVNLIVMIGVLLYVLFTLVPEADKQVTPAMAPKMAFAEMYFSGGEWLIRNGAYLLIGLMLLIGWVMYLLPNWGSPRRRVWDQYIPPFSVYQRLQATLFLSTTASMLRAGIALNFILEDLAKFGTKWMRYHVKNMQAVLDSGQGSVNALAIGPLPNDTADALRVYRLIPDFKDVMSNLSEANFAAYERSIATIALVMEMVSMLLMTSFGAATVIAMFQFSDAVKASAQAVQQAAGG